MPNIKSAKKRVLVNQKKALQNKAVKTNLKTVMKKAASEGTADAIRLAIKKVDSAQEYGCAQKIRADEEARHCFPVSRRLGQHRIW